MEGKRITVYLSPETLKTLGVDITGKQLVEKALASVPDDMYEMVKYIYTKVKDKEGTPPKQNKMATPIVQKLTEKQIALGDSVIEQMLEGRQDDGSWNMGDYDTKDADVALGQQYKGEVREYILLHLRNE